MWFGIKGIAGNRAGKIDNGRATLRAQNGKMVSSSKGKREVLVEHYSKLGIPKPNARFDAEFEKEINAWAEVNVEAYDASQSLDDSVEMLVRGTPQLHTGLRIAESLYSISSLFPE